MPAAKRPERGRRRAVRQPKDHPWKDLFEAFDMFDPKFPIDRHQPQQQVRKSLGELFPPKCRRP